MWFCGRVEVGKASRALGVVHDGVSDAPAMMVTATSVLEPPSRLCWTAGWERYSMHIDGSHIEAEAPLSKDHGLSISGSGVRAHDHCATQYTSEAQQTVVVFVVMDKTIRRRPAVRCPTFHSAGGQGAARLVDTILYRHTTDDRKRSMGPGDRMTSSGSAFNEESYRPTGIR